MAEFTLDSEGSQRGVYSSVCSFCRHYRGEHRCAAFDNIPEEIWEGFNSHQQPYPGDNGIQFEPREADGQ